MIRWMWKHRRQWKDMRELWENRREIDGIMFDLYLHAVCPGVPDTSLEEIADNGSACYQWLQYTVGGHGIRPPRPWPPPPKSARMAKDEGDAPCD